MKKFSGLVLSSQKGFTILETVFVVAIFGVLAAVVLITLTGPAKNVEAGQIPTGGIPEINGLQDAEETSTLDALDSDNATIDWQQVQSTANQAAAKMELKVVQTAVDTMMIKEGLAKVQKTSATDDMTDFPQGSPLYPLYLRDETTNNRYTCDETGQVKPAS